MERKALVIYCHFFNRADEGSVRNAVLLDTMQICISQCCGKCGRDALLSATLVIQF
jgi:hypothetical protein